jgi:hypothetical protein
MFLVDSDAARLNDPKFARRRVDCKSIDQSLNENPYSGEKDHRDRAELPNQEVVPGISEHIRNRKIQIEGHEDAAV